MNKISADDSSENCCIDNNKIILLTPPYKPSNKYQYLLATTTLEPLMPIRLYYSVPRPHKLVGHFCSMGCVTRSKGSYTFLYQEETESLCLGVRAHEVKAEHRPAVIGRAQVDYKQHTMIFDTDSFQRAINIVNFLDHHIPKDAAELRSVATYNRFIFTNSSRGIKFIAYENYNNIFSEFNMKSIDAKTNNVSIDLLEVQEKQKMLSDYPVIEQFPAWDVEDEIDNLENILQLKIAIARSISDGVNCSMWEFYRYIASEGKLN